MNFLKGAAIGTSGCLTLLLLASASRSLWVFLAALVLALGAIIISIALLELIGAWRRK